MAATTTAALHGRDAELTVLRETVHTLRSGTGVVVVIEGSPGIGKSRLLAEAVRMAGRLPARVGLGEADPSEAVVELAPLLRALFDGAAPLLESVPIAWILAARPVQPGSGVSEVVEQLVSRGARRITLEPLTPAAVAELASDVMRASPDQALLELAANAAGNPFFLVELLRGLREERLVRIEDGVARLLDARLPKRVAAGMRYRLARLSESARQLALAAASLGRTFTIGDLASMLGAPAASVLTRSSS